MPIQKHPKKANQKNSKRYRRILPFSRSGALLVMSGAFVLCAGIFLWLTHQHDFLRQTNNFTSTHIATTKDSIASTTVPAVDVYTGNLAAVAVDNFVSVRPQYGLSSALWIIEAPVEGGITRLLAFFPLTSSATVDRIGPVRSARPYFVDFAQGYDALMVHVGGSPKALSMLMHGTVVDLNEFYQSAYFWHDVRSVRPHNTFTKTELLKDFVQSTHKMSTTTLSLVPADFTAYFTQVTTHKATDVVIDFSYSEYRAQWHYDVATQSYTRQQGGKPHKDAVNNKQLTATTIIVAETDIATIDAMGRKRLRTTGEGNALVFFQGKTWPATWKRDAAGKFHLYDTSGTERIFSYDHLWWEIVNTLEQVTFE